MRTAEEMRGVLENWESSGLTQKAFGEREGVSVTTLQYWRRRLKEIDGESEAPAFGPVRVVPDGSVSEDRFELRIGGSVSITVPPRFDAEALRRLVSAVRGC